MKTLKKVLCVLLSVLCFTVFSQAQTLPIKKLAIYYGWPLYVNGDRDTTDIINTLSEYDIVVFGENLETQFGANSDLQTIIEELVDDDKEVFGYVTIGNQNNSGLTAAQITERIGQWGVLGVNGIFFDEGGYDFGVTRGRQNTAVQAAHDLGLMVMMNAWMPDDVLANVNNEEPVLGNDANVEDYYLLESFMIQAGQGYVNFNANEAANRYNTALTHKNNSPNLNIATVTTTNQAGFSQCQYDYAWWATVAYGFDAMGWGERQFASVGANSIQNWLPLHTARTGGDVGEPIAATPTINNGIITRNTANNGLITINTTNHNISYQTNGNNQFVFDNAEDDCLETPGEALFATNASGDIYWYKENQWLKIGGPGAQFAWADGAFYGLSPDRNTVLEFNGSTLQWIGAGNSAAEIIGGTALRATNPQSGSIFQFNRDTRTWSIVGSAGAQFVSANGSLCALTPTRNATMQRSNSGWSRIGGSAELLIGGKYLCSINPSNGGISMYRNGQWSGIGGGGADFVWANGKLYGLTPRGSNGLSNVMEYSISNNNWQMVGQAATQIFGGDYLYITRQDGNYYEYKNGNWTNIGRPQ